MAEQVFVSEDEHGNPSFTDQPDSNSKAINVAPANTIELETPDISTYEAPPKATSYQVNIATPKPETTYQNPAEPIVVIINTTPSLGAHQLILLHNEEPIDLGKSQSKSFPDLYRGSHTFVAQLVNKSGKLISSSAPVTIYVHRHIKQQAKPAPLPH